MTTAGTAAVDGRTARSRRTRSAVVDALIALVEEGDPRPTVQTIAARAGISGRAVHLHFQTVADLHEALVERATELVVERLAVIDPEESLPVRIDLLCGQRARINHDVGALLRAADLYEQTSPTIAESRAFGRRASREQLHRIFASELRHLRPSARSRAVAVIDAVLTQASWATMRETHGLSTDEARIATCEAVRAVLERATT